MLQQSYVYTTGSVCECKQMSFQWLFESTGISKFPETNRKIIPSFGSGVGEASLAELALQERKFASKCSKI